MKGRKCVHSFILFSLFEHGIAIGNRQFHLEVIFRMLNMTSKLQQEKKINFSHPFCAHHFHFVLHSVCLWPKYVVYLVLALQHQWKANRWYVYNLITPLLPRNDWIIFYPLKATTLSEALKNKINNCRRSMSKALMKGPNTTCNLSWR